MRTYPQLHIHGDAHIPVHLHRFTHPCTQVQTHGRSHAHVRTHRHAHPPIHKHIPTHRHTNAHTGECEFTCNDLGCFSAANAIFILCSAFSEGSRVIKVEFQGFSTVSLPFSSVEQVFDSFLSPFQIVARFLPHHCSPFFVSPLLLLL